MSTFKRKGAKTYEYDFRLGGRRFLGNTREVEKRAAERFEAALKLKAKADVQAAVAFDAPRTWAQASSRYWDEVGQHHKALDLTLMAMEWLSREIGSDTLLTAIDDNLVSRLVAKRRAQKRQVGRRKERAKQRPVSNATVNRTCTEPLRKVMLRAEKVWRVPVGLVDWSQHMLPEPKERVREASEGEEAAVMGHLERGYQEAVQFAFDNGLRRMELLTLKKTMVDFFTGQFTVLGKGGKERLIPMSDRTRAQLWRLKDTPTEYVFTFVAARTNRKCRYVKGEHYPLTEHGLRTAWRRAIARAGVPNLHPHDSRHTAATRTLRASNIKVVQRLLGHEDIATTGKYAHAMIEDMRAALNASTAVKSAVQPEAPNDNVLTEKGNG
jgi:integrase